MLECSDEAEPAATSSPLDIELAQKLIRIEDGARQTASKAEQVLVSGHQCIGFPRQCQFQKRQVERIPTGRRRRRGNAHRLAILQAVRQQFFLLVRGKPELGLGQGTDQFGGCRSRHQRDGADEADGLEMQSGSGFEEGEMKCEMSLTPLVLLMILLLLAGCASYSGRGLVAGQSPVSDVIAVMGEPRMQWADADGSRRFAYPRGPMGVDTYMVRIGANGKLLDIANVLTVKEFARIEAGMSKDQVLRMLGPPEPSWTVYFKQRDELVWEWRYAQRPNFFARFYILFDGTKGIVRSTMTLTEEQLLAPD